MLSDARTSQHLFQEYLMFTMRRVYYRLSERKGQTMTEYALLLGGIALAAVAGYNSLGAATNSAVNSASQLLASSSGSTSSGAGSGGSGSGDTGGGSGHHHGHHGGGFGGGHHWGGGSGFGF
jgi:Flp pilus assembly pilin Flp